MPTRDFPLDEAPPVPASAATSDDLPNIIPPRDRAGRRAVLTAVPALVAVALLILAGALL